VLAEINSRVAREAVTALGLPGLIPKYVGMSRPHLMLNESEVVSRFSGLSPTDVEANNSVALGLFDELEEAYEHWLSVQEPRLEARIERQLSTYTSNRIQEARNLANDILYSVGAVRSAEQRESEVATFYTLDELFYHSRNILPSGVNIRWSHFFACLNLCTVYRHHSFYRLFESLLLALKKTNAAGENDRERSRYLNLIHGGLSILGHDEGDDGLWLWQAFQGNATEQRPVPVTVLTTDRKGAERAKALSLLLREKYNGRSIEEIMKEKVAFRPGEILVFDAETLTNHQLIRIQDL